MENGIETIDMGVLADGPHAELIEEMAERVYADSAVQAIWVGGSLAAGTGDNYSDIDFRIAVAPGTVGEWHEVEWGNYLPIAVCGGTFMQFSEQALLHHLLLADGTIVDFFVQDTERRNGEPALVVLACRDEAFGEKLAGFATSISLGHPIDGSMVRQFLVDYWITTHKELKGFARGYEHGYFVGLYHERVALLRAWHMQAAGNDVGGRVTIHVLGGLRRALDGSLSADQRALLGWPTRTAEETAEAIEQIRAEMAEVGRWLAEKYKFEYPQALEEVVTRTWEAEKPTLLGDE